MKLHDWEKASATYDVDGTIRTRCRVCGFIVWGLKKFSAEEWVSKYYPLEEDCNAVVARQILEE